MSHDRVQPPLEGTVVCVYLAGCRDDNPVIHETAFLPCLVTFGDSFQTCSSLFFFGEVMWCCCYLVLFDPFMLFKAFCIHFCIIELQKAVSSCISRYT